MAKRVLDTSAAVLGLVGLSPVFLLVAVIVKIDSRGPVFFRQERIGRGFRPFVIYKFRTMRSDVAGRPITCGEDPRITRSGRFLRRTKIDELPQLLNVLKGNMSIVGPRPELRRYVEALRADYEEILSVRPGLTDWASLKFRNEAAVLSGFDDPEGVYLERILPAKVTLAKKYVRESSLAVDLTIVVNTLKALSGLKVGVVN